MMQYGGGFPDFLRQLMMQMYAGGLGQSYGGFGAGQPQMPRPPMQRPTTRAPQRRSLGSSPRPPASGGGVPFAGPSNRTAPSFSTPPLPGSGMGSMPGGDPVAAAMARFPVMPLPGS